MFSKTLSPLKISDRFFALLLLAICLLTLPGCLLNHSRHTVVRQNEPLRSVAFESEQARIAFEEIVKEKSEDSESDAQLAIPFLLGLDWSNRLSASAVRNDAIAQLDINRDGIISDYETSLKR